MMTRARFITFEGADAVGKSVQLRAVRAALTRAGVESIATQEPGGTALGKQLRALVKTAAFQAASPRIQALLFMSARRLHVEEVIRPALQAGRWVLCDRFCDSTFVYQGLGKDGIRLATLRAWHKEFGGRLLPDCTILLEASAPQTQNRLRSRTRGGGKLQGFDARSSGWQARIRARFRALARAEPRRFLRFDTSKHEPRETTAAILEALHRRFPL